MNIDAVYTWVNHADQAWQKLYRDSVDSDTDFDHASSNNLARFQNRNELLYSIKSLRRFAPWLRHIYIVTNCQLPAELRSCSDITGVDHGEIFPDSSVLPTFNSVAIECNLHRIEGLSEHFLYFNDDFFLCAPFEPSDFFSMDGKSYLFPSNTSIPDSRGRGIRPSEHHALNAASIIEQDLGFRPEKKLHHAPYPMLRSTLEEIERNYPAQIESTCGNRFRCADDLPVATTFHAYYALAKGYGEIGDIDSRYIDIGDPLFLLLIHPFSPLRRGKYSTFCLNEVTHLKYFAKQRDLIVERFLRAMLDD